mgnify:FL=1|jgi:chromatin remodeling complex protein RSC6|tara:strand:+ start:91 stop:1497 length:1407 start_codon:yes stop_codon:yes gene_type:complete
MPSQNVSKVKLRQQRQLAQQQLQYERRVFDSYRKRFRNPHVPPTIRQSSIANATADCERRVECALSRKRAEMIECGDPLAPHEKRGKILRVYLFNTHNNVDGESGKVLKFTLGKKKEKKALQDVEEETTTEKNPDGTHKRWTFHVQGRVVDERDEEVDARQVLEGLKFSHFIEWMKIEVFDESIAVAASAGETASKKRKTMGGEHEKKGGKLVKSVTWERKECGIPKDGFTITVPGAKDSMRVRCEIQLRNDPPKFTLSGMLADIIGKEEESAGRVMYALWSRCKALELVSEKDKSMIELDETFFELCGKNPLFKESKVGDIVPFRSVCIACTSRTHMSKISDPLVFEYKVRPYGPSPAHCDCYDVNVETLPPAAYGQNSAVTKYSGATNESEELEQRIFQDSNFIDFARKRRAYLLSFSQDPQAFIDNCINEYTEMFEGIPRRKEAWSKEWTSDAAMRVLEKLEKRS